MLLAVSVASLLLGCLPAAAIVWWAAAGRIARAREDQREADPLLLNARVIAAVGTVMVSLRKSARSDMAAECRRPGAMQAVRP